MTYSIRLFLFRINWSESESGLCSLSPALLPLQPWLHFKGPLCQAPEVSGWHRPHPGWRQVCLQTGGKHSQICGDDSFKTNPLHSPTHHHGQHCGCSRVNQISGNLHLSGAEVGQSHWLYCEKCPAEAVFPSPAE